MKKHIYKIFVLIFPALLWGNSCSESDFLDINTDPNFPAEASEIFLLPAAQANATLGVANMLERGAATMVQHYINGRFDNYGFDGSTYNNDWGFNLYGGGLIDFETIINQGTERENFQYVGVAKIQKAYYFSLIVDLFGDVPFSEALQGQENFSPKIDDGAEIYESLFNLINEGIADLDKPSGLTMGSDDLFYGGDMDAWKRMANTLKIKLLNQIRLVNPSRATSEINQLIGQGNLISSNAENYQLEFGTSITPENRHPNFQADYAGGGLENSMSDYMFNLLTTNNDPRIPYYIYNQTACAFTGRNGGETANPGDDEQRSTFGVYPIGGKFDDGSCQAVNSNSGSGAGVFPMITNSMRAFILAEAALTLGTTGDAKAYMEEGILAAMEQVGSFSGIAVVGTEDYLAARLAAYDAAISDEERLEVIMMEKYVAMYGNGIESYNDFRRTGYPNNLNTPILENGPFPMRFPIPPTETTTNENISTDAQDPSIPVFWDIN